MTNDKSFEVRISKAPIEMLDFIFEADANGSVEISVSENGVPKPKQIATAGNSKKVSVVKSNFANYSITAKATAVGGKAFDKWTDEASGSNNSLVVSSDIAGTITANFISQNSSIEVLCTFTAPDKVEVTVKHLGGVESYVQGTHYLVVKRAETIELIMNTAYPNRIDGIDIEHAPNSEITTNGFGTYSKKTFDMSKGTSSSASFVINVL